VDKLSAVAVSGAMNVQKDNITLFEPGEIKTALNSVIDQACKTSPTGRCWRKCFLLTVAVRGM